MACDIPIVLSDPYFRSTCPLPRADGSTITMSFDFKWNTRDLSWYFDVLDDAEHRVVSSVRLVRGIYLGRRTRHEIFRNGALVCLCKVKGEPRECGFDDLGRTHVLRYYTVLDVLVGRRQLPLPIAGSGA